MGGDSGVNVDAPGTEALCPIADEWQGFYSLAFSIDPWVDITIMVRIRSLPK